MRRTQAERVAESDRRIVASAIAVIAAGGYAAATFEAIAAGSGYSRQLVAQRFKDKDNLLALIIRQHTEALESDTRKACGGLSGLDAVFSEIDSYLHALDTPSVQSRAFFILMMESTGPAAQFRSLFVQSTSAWESTLTGHLKQGQRSGQLRIDFNPRAEAGLLIACLRGVRIQSMLDPITSDVGRSIRALKQRLAKSLLANTAGSSARSLTRR